MSIDQSRRKFLQTSSALSFLGAASPFALNLATIGAASAQAAPEYRAIVCLFMFGGNDHTNTVIPYDTAGYAEYAAARPGITIDRAALAATAVAPVASQGGREFAFHPALTTIKSLYDAGDAAVLANVGPLIQPTTKAQYQARSVPLPPKLFSHNDQQSAWMAYRALGEGARRGWGGRLGDVLAAQNTRTVFTAISASGNSLWLAGDTIVQYQIGGGGALRFNAINDATLYGSATAKTPFQRNITRVSTHLMENELNRVSQRSIEAATLIGSSLPAANFFTTPIPANNGLAGQLNTVARMIQARTALGVNRQVFFVSFGGFDNHDNLLTEHQARMTTLNNAISAFWAWMTQIGMTNNVTLFTGSDFGRTLTSNGDGSDHGWGAHHLMVGGAVNGTNVYGTFPQVTFRTNDDVGSGNLLPTTGIEQYAGTLAKWLGVSDTDMALVMPNIVNYPTRTLTFMAP
jgi:uncharacterized protein (DUF1501 family)